jgi:hypothetical protein
VIVDSFQLMSALSLSAWIPLDPLVTIMRRVAVLMEALPSPVRSNFMYAAVTGDPSEVRVVALP